MHQQPKLGGIHLCPPVPPAWPGQHSLPMKDRILNFSKILAPSPASGCAAGEGKIFPVPPNLAASAERLKSAKQTQTIFNARHYN